MPERSTQDDGYLDLQEELAGEQLDSQVQRAQEQLLSLKRQQEQIEKQKRELEELSRRQEQLTQGRAEMIEKLTRATVVLERETLDAEKRVEVLRAIDASYHQHLAALEAINPKTWEGTEINRELNKALSAVDDARAEYAKLRSKVSPEASAGGEIATVESYAAELDGMDGRPFLYWLRNGFAFTLPLLCGVAILIIVLVALFGRFN